MTVISVSDLSLAFGTNVLLQNVSFSLNENDKMGSTLLFESEYIPYRDRLIIVLHNKEHATVTKE